MKRLILWFLSLAACTTPVSPGMDAPVDASTDAPFERVPLPPVPDFTRPLPPVVEDDAALFDPFGEPVDIQITLSADARAALDADPRRYVAAEARFVVAGVATAPMQIGVRLKGRFGSFRTLDEKAAFKLDFNRYVPGQTLRGLGKVVLNNMVNDRTSLSEWFSYRLYRALGVPAPRTGLARVTVNGEGFGTYLLLEAVDDRAFRRARFESTSAIYEGEYGDDLFAESAPEYELDHGESHVPLARVIDALTRAPDQGAYAALDASVHWREVLRFMAVETFLGQWDGYTHWRNNYFLHVDDGGRLSLLPWGADSNFQKRPPFFAGRGLLLRACLRDAACIEPWREALRDVLGTVESMFVQGLENDMRALANANAARFADDPRSEQDPSSFPAQAELAIAFLRERADTLRGELACQDDPEADHDADGYACALDCDDTASDTHVGALEQCGDGIDQNCDGFVDESNACPPCHEIAEVPGLLACPGERNLADHEAACAALGATLVRIDDEARNSALRELARAQFRETGPFLGLSRTDGTFRWPDGTEPTFLAVTPPARESGADCVVMHWKEASWVGVACDTWRAPALCERSP